MRICGVTPLYPPASRVGAWLTTHEFLRHLAGRGHEVIAVPFMGARDETEYQGVTVRPKGALIEEVRAADVVISHCGDNGRAHREAQRCRIPSVRLFHGGRMTRESMARSALVVFNSDSARAQSPWPGPTIVCRPPTNPDDYRTTPGAAVTLVNLSEAKGVKTMWAAAEQLPDVEFLGVTGQTGTQERPRVRNCTILHPIDDMREVYSRTRVLLMPSRAETWGRVGVEAMCSGIPVIAHPTEGLRESLGDAGIFVDRDDIGGWVEQITRLADPVEWAAASSAALARVDQLDHRAELDRFADAIEALA